MTVERVDVAIFVRIFSFLPYMHQLLDPIEAASKPTMVLLHQTTHPPP